MQITGVSVYVRELNYVGGIYRYGRGNAVSKTKSSIVVVDTDAGISGCGEFCPCGNSYMDGYDEGVTSIAPLLAKAVIGLDPREISRVERTMDRALMGHGYAKAPFDAACWDILGKATSQPVWMLLGGKLVEGGPMYHVAPQREPGETEKELKKLRAAGYRQFQVKVGADWAVDIERIESTVPLLETGEKAFADANRGWNVDEAIRVARATRSLDYFLEQPCPTYEECLQVRRRVDLPMKLDESLTGLAMAQRLVNDRAAEVACLKISRIGGLSKTRRMRDFLVENGVPVVCEDAWGGEITTATLAHLAASTPAELLVSTTDLHNYNVERTGKPAPDTRDGKLFAADGPGLGVEPDYETLGPPVYTSG